MIQAEDAQVTEVDTQAPQEQKRTRMETLTEGIALWVMPLNPVPTSKNA